jgi:hypothetical protein
LLLAKLHLWIQICVCHIVERNNVLVHTCSQNRISTEINKLQEMKDTKLPLTLKTTLCLFPLHGELSLFNLMQFYIHKTP